MQRDYDDAERKTVDFSVLKGKTIASIEGSVGAEALRILTTDGEVYEQNYYEDCCASCSIEEIHGDLQDLVGSPILMAEEVSSTTPDTALQAKRDAEKAEAKKTGAYYSDYQYESETWTFYKAATIKGSVTIRWYGSSNGYYSESPTFEYAGKATK